MRKLLIAEDDQDIMEMMKIVLIQHFEIIEAIDGQEALEKAREHKPDLVLLNMMMPKMDGLTVCRRLKESDDTMNIPVAFISALVGTRYIRAGVEAGAVDYITKPFHVFELPARLMKNIEGGQHVNSYDGIGSG